MEKTIPIDGGFFQCPERASEITGLNSQTLYNWTTAKATSYGYPLNVVEHQGHRLIDERDVHAVAAVQKNFPIGKGPVSPERREQMKNYAAKIRATLTPHAVA